VRRFVLLGASNLTAAFPLIVDRLHAGCEGSISVMAALGHGRSYGNWSRVLFRGLPGIVGCRLWDDFSEAARTDCEASTDCPTLALLTDIGNDLIYGAPVETILEWIDVCLDRLKSHDAEVILTRLPMSSIERLSSFRFHLTRTLFFPNSRIGWREMRDRAGELNQGLLDVAGRYNARVIEPSASWYGFDPIHIRWSRRAEAWSELLSDWPGFAIADDQSRTAPGRDTLRGVANLRPAERRWFGRTQRTAQPALRLDDLTVSLY